MSAPELMNQLQHQPFSVNIAESTWMFPGLETLHVLAITLVVGSVVMMDMRLLGVGRGSPASQVLARSLPWTWGAFAVALVAGSLLFCSKAAIYYENIPFRIKMVCLLLAGVNMLVFHGLTARHMSEWDRGPTPVTARVAGGISICLWIIIVAMGRWVGFTY
jgi:hypothetical protein